MGRPKKIKDDNTIKETVSISKLEKLRDLMLDINKQYGKEMVHFASEEKPRECIPFGIKELDELLNGGVRCGVFSTIWGGKGSGKTSLAYYLEAQAQKLNKVVYHIALEPFDKERAELFGVDTNKLMVGQFPIAEQSLDSIIKLAKEGVVDLIVLDSIHSLSPKQEQEDKKGDKSVEADSMALLARKLSQFFRMAVDAIKRNNVAVLLIGQSRTNVGFIAIDQLTGGNALHHNSRLILRVSRGQGADAPTEKVTNEEGKKESKVCGFDCRIKIEKNQIGAKPELSEIHLPYLFENGFNKLREVKDE